jgi:hypothetical protein
VKLRLLAIATLALVLPLLATSCGDNDSGGLSEREISTTLQDRGVPEAAADCMAGELKDANLTKEDLAELDEISAQRSKAGKAVIAALTTCMTSSSN